MSQPQPNTEYLTTRLQQLGISDQVNTFTRVWTNKSDEKNAVGEIVTIEKEYSQDYKIFDADEHGNIVIHYFNLDGQPYRWRKEDTKQTRDFVRLRLREPKGNMKYSQPDGSPVVPFFPPAIIQKYKACKAHSSLSPGEGQGEANPHTIPVLYLVEGEFKAFKAGLLNIDIVGLPGIHGFYSADIKGKLHEDIEELIVTCEVEKIVLLFDADFLSVKWSEDKDLSKRPQSFYGSIKAYRESLQVLIDSDKVNLKYVYFMHLASKYMNDAKGIDDLLSKYEDKSVEIQTDLCELSTARKYFFGKQINDLNKDVQGFVYRYLGLSDEQEFYKTYGEFIGAREFKFKQRRYQYDAEKREVMFVKHEDADKFMRIGPDWVKVIVKKNKFGENEQEIVSWKISEIQRDYKKFPDFLDQILKYDDFCNEPNFNGEYKRTVEGCYNLVEPLRWQPKAGSIASTMGFIKHIFQGKGEVILNDQGQVEREESIIGDQFTVALDYLTILFKHPKHMLPVPILVSPENGTGKSTFLKWLQMLFGSNMCILGNEQFKMKFNGHYITKYIIAIDEGFLEVDKKAEKERLKQLVTADSVYLENKGMNVRRINYYGKLIISSNDADRVMKIEDGESRWFVVRVPVIPADKRDPDLELKLKTEAEAFLHFIYHRSIVHPRADRLWFKPEWFITEQFKVIVETTKARIDRVFESWIRDQFLLFKLPVLRYTTNFLIGVFNDPKNSKYKIDELDLRNYLTNKGLKPERESMYHKSPKGFKDTTYTEGSGAEPLDITPAIVWWCGTGRPYTFRAEDWLNGDDLDAINVKGPDQPKPTTDETPF